MVYDNHGKSSRKEGYEPHRVWRPSDVVTRISPEKQI